MSHTSNAVSADLPQRCAAELAQGPVWPGDRGVSATRARIA